MIIKWKNVPDIYNYVCKTLAMEAEDIPIDKIDKGIWYLDEIDISQIITDKEMIERHDQNSLHIQRRDNFIDLIKKGKEILPLIILGEDLFLVDGYARYRALKKLEINKVKLFRQRFSL
ncbi:MAG: hypothetical protein Q7R97_05675 [Candidatus Daviesbacteria bacterium]|nr:hypothetical protein [Candidatus Daviesbacteria bacterium]